MGEDLENAAGDILHVWTSPLRLSGSDLPALIAVTEVIVLTGTFDDDIQQWIREHPRSLPVRLLAPVRDPAPLSYLGRSFVLQPLSLLLYTTGSVLDNDALREAGIGCATANMANTLARFTISALTGRRRPMYGGDPYDFEPLEWSDWPRRSFPGGHAANIMACTAVWSEHFDLGMAEPLLYAIAIALGAGRTVSEAHWASDTLFGLTFGWAVGREVAERLSEREADERRTPQTRSGSRPTLYIGWRIPVQ